MNAEATIQIREVGLRDGLQSLSRTLPTAQKLEWIAGAHAAGLREIEVGSFVPARLLPFSAGRGLRSEIACEALHGTIARAGLPTTMPAA